MWSQELKSLLIGGSTKWVLAFLFSVYLVLSIVSYQYLWLGRQKFVQRKQLMVKNKERGGGGEVKTMSFHLLNYLSWYSLEYLDTPEELSK